MIIKKYDSEAVADRIIANKTATEEVRKTQTKPHPDDPENPEPGLQSILMHVIVIHKYSNSIRSI